MKKFGFYKRNYARPSPSPKIIAVRRDGDILYIFSFEKSKGARPDCNCNVFAVNGCINNHHKSNKLHPQQRNDIKDGAGKSQGRSMESTFRYNIVSG